VLRDGRDITIITTGIMVSEGLEAAEILEEKGYSASVIHMPTVKPLDTDILLQAAHQTRGIVTAEEHSIIGGLGEAVAGFTSESHPIPVQRVGVNDLFGESGKCKELLDLHGLRARNIVEKALMILEGKK